MGGRGVSFDNKLMVQLYRNLFSVNLKQNLNDAKDVFT